jgi:hypothetical protein
MSADDMLKLIDGLQKLVRKAEAEDEPANRDYGLLGAEDRALRHSANIGMDRRPGGSRVKSGDADAETEFRKMFPDARPLVRG